MARMGIATTVSMRITTYSAVRALMTATWFGQIAA